MFTPEVNSQSIEFAAVRSAVAALLSVTQAAAGQELVKLRATQFERLVSALQSGRNEDQQRALLRIALAENCAETARATAHEAASAIGRLSVDHDVANRALELVAETETQATAANFYAAAAAEAVATLEIKDLVEHLREVAGVPEGSGPGEVMRAAIVLAGDHHALSVRLQAAEARLATQLKPAVPPAAEVQTDPPAVAEAATNVKSSIPLGVTSDAAEDEEESDPPRAA